MNERKPRILLVDGDAGLLSIRWLRLLLEGYEVRQLLDGAMLGETLESFRPDLLVVDPAVCAPSQLDQVRSDPRSVALKIVVNSAAPPDGEPADAWLDKPAGHAALRATIRRLLAAAQFGGSR